MKLNYKNGKMYFGNIFKKVYVQPDEISLIEVTAFTNVSATFINGEKHEIVYKRNPLMSTHADLLDFAYKNHISYINYGYGPEEDEKSYSKNEALEILNSKQAGFIEYGQKIVVQKYGPEYSLVGQVDEADDELVIRLFILKDGNKYATAGLYGLQLFNAYKYDGMTNEYSYVCEYESPEADVIYTDLEDMIVNPIK